MKSAGTAGSPELRPKPLANRNYFQNGGGIAWSVPKGMHIVFAGEGEWKITIDVFRDLGLAFGAAMLDDLRDPRRPDASFVVPLVVMLAIPLTVLGVMPGFWLLNRMFGQNVDGCRPCLSSRPRQ